MKDRAPRIPTRQHAPAAPDPDDLGQQARELLAPFFRRRKFAAGKLLWSEGDRAGLVVAITKGRVKVFREPPSGRPVTLYIFGPGKLFGFMPLIDGSPYPASAQTLEEVEALVLTREQLFEALEQRPTLAISLISLLGKRLRESFEHVEGISTRGTQLRVAAALDALMAESPGAGPATLVSLPVAASEFAAAIGISPESFSRAVTRLGALGLVHRLGPRRLQVLDPEGLRTLARGAGAEG